MRAILAALAALLLTPTFALAAISTPTLIATGSQSSGVAVTTTVDAPIGSLIVVLADSKTPTVACTTSGSDALTLAAGVSGGAPAAVAIYFVANSAHDLPIGSTFTCTTTTGGYDLRAYIVTGALLGVDGAATNSTGGGGTTTQTATTAALASNREIAFGATSLSSGQTGWVESSGFTTLAGQGSPDDNFDFGYKILTSSAAVTYSTSWGSNTRVSVAVATFKAPNVGGHTLGLMGIGVAGNDNHPLQELRLAAR